VSALADWARAILRWRFSRFAVVGTGGFIVNWVALYVALHVVHLDKYSGWIVSFLIAATFTWWGNRTLTFRDRATQSNFAREWATFLTANAFGGAVNFITYLALVKFAPAPINNPLIAVAGGAIAGMMFNFVVSHAIVFRTPR
jgi:putative flippase GtrA